MSNFIHEEQLQGGKVFTKFQVLPAIGKPEYHGTPIHKLSNSYIMTLLENNKLSIEMRVYPGLREDLRRTLEYRLINFLCGDELGGRNNLAASVYYYYMDQPKNCRPFILSQTFTSTSESLKGQYVKSNDLFEGLI